MRGAGDQRQSCAQCCVGRRPFTVGLGLENLGVELDKAGRVLIDEHTFRVGKFSNIYAVCDAVRGPMLAHKAEEEGVAVAEIIAGKA
ncbi:MAG: FAD-dependent oxidoreductase, partial [Rhodobacteraceae bacterium]|nr:FAD-dependent oxidoreductase [Paracoccaceae bacterium]